jgi:hypothetical protein
MATRKRQPSQLRFAAKLLFQVKIVLRGRSSQTRVCDERIVVYRATSAEEAHCIAKARGRNAEFHYKNDEGRSVFFKFVGIIELMHLGVECARDEVWSDLRRLRISRDRVSNIIPPKRFLSALWKPPSRARVAQPCR